MKTILCFGDSNTWGYIPVTGYRRPFGERWTGIMAGLLGKEYKVEEEAVNGRTTCFDDPIYPKRRGTEFFEEVLLTNYPIDLIIIMLGTNDSKIHLHQNSFSVSVGMEQLIRTALKACEYGPGYGEDGKAPKVLVVAPPLISENIVNRPISNDFDLSSVETVKGLAPLYKELADRYGCGFLNAAYYTEASNEDCLHITAESHKRLAKAMAEKVKELIG